MPQAPQRHMPATPPPQPPRLQQPHGRSSLWLGALGVVLGLLGLLVGVAAWFRAAPHEAVDVYTEQQVADAKKAVCEAYAEGVRSIWVAGGKKADNPSDALPIAVNTRLAEVAMGDYLINALHANSAVPAELRELATKLASTYQKMALIQLSDGTPLDYEPDRRIADEVIPKLDQICQ